MKLLLLALMATLASAANVCPAPVVGRNPSRDGQNPGRDRQRVASSTSRIGATAEAVKSWSAKSGQKSSNMSCVANEVTGPVAVEWPVAGIVRASVAARVELAVCCFDSEIVSPAPVRLDDVVFRVPTHQEAAEAQGNDDDFPDLIEDEAHAKTISIRGELSDGDRPFRVDILLRCSASKFASQYAFQFTVINRSPDAVEIDWDHLRQLRAAATPSIQNVTDGVAYIFLTAKRPREVPATVELKTKSGKSLGTFRFDAFTL